MITPLRTTSPCQIARTLVANEAGSRLKVCTSDSQDMPGHQTLVPVAHPERGEPLFYLGLHARRTRATRRTPEEATGLASELRGPRLLEHRAPCARLMFQKIDLPNHEDYSL